MEHDTIHTQRNSNISHVQSSNSDEILANHSNTSIDMMETDMDDPDHNLIIQGVVGDKSNNSKCYQKVQQPKIKGFIIQDIKSMADEVNGILNSMEKYMSIQRKRRLQKLKPPSRMYRNWYIAAMAVPVTGYVAYKLMQGNVGSRLAAEVYAKICTFFAEHVSEPIVSM